MPGWDASWRALFRGAIAGSVPKSPRVSEFEGVLVRGHGRAAVDNPGSLDINDNSLTGRIG